MVFIAGIIAVAIAFMYNATISNPIFDFTPEDSGFKEMVSGIADILSVFFIFLVNYGFSTLFAERKKESNVFISLGASRLQLYGLMCIESLLIFTISFFIGLAIGFLLSCLTVLLIATIFLEVTAVDITTFCLTTFQKCLFLTIVSWVIVSARNYYALVITNKNTAAKVNYKIREFAKIDYVLFSLGMVFLVFTLQNQYLYAVADTNNVGQTLLFATTGSLLVIYSFGGILIKRAERKADLLVLNHLRANYKNYVKLMVSMTLLVIFGVYFLGMVTIYLDNRDTSELLEGNIYDLVYETPNLTDDPSILGINQNDVIKKIAISSAVGVMKISDFQVIMIPETDYYRLTGEILGLEKGFTHLVSQMSHQKTNWIGFGVIAEISVNGQDLRCIVNGETWEYLFNTPIKRIFVLNDSDFQEIDINSLTRKYLVKLRDWELGKNVTLKNQDNDEIISLISKYDQYSIKLAEQNSLVFFITLAVAIFFILLGCLLYFKVSTDIPIVKDRNRHLQNIGICGDNIRKSTYNSYKLFFAMPTGIGVFYGSALVFIFTYIILGHISYQIFVIAFVFIISQYAFYRYTMKKLVIKKSD